MPMMRPPPSRLGMAAPMTAESCRGQAPAASHSLRSEARPSKPSSGMRCRSTGPTLSMPRALPELMRRKAARA
eukprot:5294479-Pyramimonas_sp.AAC.1